MTIRIIKVEKPNALFCHYERQTERQDCYIELDCIGQTLHATYNGEIGNAVPTSVYHGHDNRFGIPCLTNDAANKLMEELLPLAERVIAGYTSEWDGNNNVARFTPDAQEAIEEINSTCEALEGDEGEIAEWNADDWLQNLIHYRDEDDKPCKWNQAVKVIIDDVGVITKGTTDDELSAIEQLIEDDIESNMVLNGLSKFLENERSYCINNADDN